MTMSILAILISFAMMLTGAGGEGQPAEASRTLLLHDINFTYNGETVELAPSLRLGASTDGQKAVFDAGVELNGGTLFPVQLGVDDSGITALFKASNVAAKVSADALNGLTEQASQMMQGIQTQLAEGENSELMDFIVNEYVPAYTGLLEAVRDPEYLKALQAKGNEVALSILDRGEGTPVTEEYEGQEYALVEYHYTVGNDQMAQLVDAVYTCDEKLAAYYNVMFKMYDLMPEESGLKGLKSFKDMFEKLNISMTMEIDEKVSDDGEVDFTNATVTLDLNQMMQAMAGMNGEADETASSDIPELPPLEMNVVGNKVGEHQDAVVSCYYEVNGASMNMTASTITEGENEMHILMSLGAVDENQQAGNFVLSEDLNKYEATGDSKYFANLRFMMAYNGVSFYSSGVCKENGESENYFDCSVNSEGASFDVSFNVDVTDGAIIDEANGHEAAVTLNDLSQETLGALGQDQATQAALMQVVGSMSADAQKLTADESVQKLVALFGAMTGSGAEETEYVDDSFEGEDDDYREDEYQEIEDDGVLGYNEPEFTWLPEGWEVKEKDIDTAYDWVSLTLGDANDESYAYVTIFQDSDDNSVNYVVGGDGEIEAVDGREFTVNDFGDGSVSVSLRESNLFTSMTFVGDDIDVETIGHIIAGIQF